MSSPPLRALPGCTAILAVFAALVPVLLPTLHAQEQLPETEHARALSRAFRYAAERSTPSVVTVIGKVHPRWLDRQQQLRELLQDPRWEDVLPEEGLPPDVDRTRQLDGERSESRAMQSQLGSGVIVDQTGLILTNNHVVAGADEVLIRLSNGLEAVATRVQGDPLSDVAVLQIRPPGPLAAARLGDSDLLEIGDWVIAVGSPFELEATVSAGIISGKGRSIDKIRSGSLLQTDAAINPGNSGGPLVNLDGEVIGINTAIASSSGGYQGIGFAIPINRAKWVLDQLREHGHVRRAYLGVEIGEVTAPIARRLGTGVRSGVLVENVLPEGPADRAGLVRDDVIVSFDGRDVRHPHDLQDVVERGEVGSRRLVRLWRSGEHLTLPVVLQSLPEDVPRPLPGAP